MTDAIAGMRVPTGDAVADMPVPAGGASPQADYADTTASPMQKGFRSGMNSLGASLNALVGQTGEALGLQEFAADRFKDAEQYTAAANTPGIKNWGEVKDFTTLTHFVGNLIGSSTAQTLPALGLSVGLRRPVAGVMAGMAPVEAGSQVQTLRQDPVAMAKGPGSILANAAGTGIVNAGIDATLGGEGQMARRALGQATKEGVGKAIAKGVVGEGLTEPAQNLVGQVAHQQLNPDKKIDTNSLKEDAIGGAIMGGVFGAAGHAVGAAPRALQGVAQSADELKQRFKKPTAPADPNVDMPPESVASKEDILSWLQETENQGTEYLGKKWDAVKDSGIWKSSEEFIRDPEVRTAAAQNMKEDWHNSKVKPVLEGTLAYGKDLVERIAAKRKTKYSNMENKPDFEEMQNDVLSGNPIYVKGENPDVSDFMVNNQYKQTEDGKWEPLRKRSAMRTKTDTLILQTITHALPDEFKATMKPEQVMEVADVFKKLAENPEEFTESGVPRVLIKQLGGHEVFRDVMKQIQEIVGTDHGPVAKSFKAHERGVDTQLRDVQKIIHAYSRPDNLMHTDRFEVLMDKAAPWLADQLHKGEVDPEYQAKFNEIFDPQHHETAAKALERLKDRPMTMNDAFNGGEGTELRDDHGNLTVDDQGERQQESPARDKRLDQTFNDTPDGVKEMDRVRATLEAEFGRKNVRIQEYEVAPGKLGLRLENADTVGLTPNMLRAVREDPKQNRSKLIEGVISVVTDKNPGGVKINLHKLTAEMMRTEPPAGREGTEIDYVRDMFARGMSALMNTGEVRGFTKSGKEQLIRKTAAGTWDFPDSTPIVKMHGHQYTYGEIKKFKISRKELRGITEDDIKSEEQRLRDSADYKKNPLSAGATRIKATENAVERARQRAEDLTYLDPRDIPRVEETANDSKPSEKSRDAAGGRTYEEDLGGAATSIGGATAPSFPAGGETKKVEQGKPEKVVTHTKSTADKLVEQLAKDTQDKNKGKPNYRANKDNKFSTMNIGEGTVTPEQRKAVRDYIKKVLGPDVAVQFLKKLEAAGEFHLKMSGEELIKISAMAADPMSVGHHEAVHALFARLLKANPKAAHTLLRAASSPAIIARLRTLLKDHPKALEQLKDPEERLAYMYQFAAAGKKGLINLGPETKTWFEQVKSLFRKIAAVWADDFATAEAVEKAGEILGAFHEGAFANRSTVAEVLKDRFPRGAYEAAEEMIPWAAKLANKFIWTATGSVRDANIPAMTNIMDLFHTEISGGYSNKPGFLQEKHVAYNRFINRVQDVFPKTAERQRLVWEDLHTGEPAKTTEGKAIRAILEDAFQYLQDKGVKRFARDKNGKIKTNKGKPVYEEVTPIDNYFPRVPDFDYMNSDEGKAAFIAMLVKNKVPADEALSAYEKISKTDNTKPEEEDYIMGLTYYTPATNQRTLGFIPEAEMAPFMNKDLFGTLSQYLQRATRRGEYTTRFGNAGEDIKEARQEAIKDGATTIQLKAFDDAVQAMEGTLGADIDPKLKGIYSGLMTYQNLRLLPLQLFASLIDPLGLMVRGATMKEAFTAFGKGLRDLATLGKTSKDDAFEIAKTMGAIDAANAHGLMSDMAGSSYMPKVQRAINDKFFRWNGMELWNNRMRSQATIAAMNFIDRHMNRPTEHSARFMEELNLKKGDKLDISNPDYVAAVNKWVDEAILRPNAAHRPVYMSDPNWMLISHLKQYTYMFQKTVVARVYHELQHNNYTPAFALASYVPGMMAADMLKMFLTPGSGDDNARAGWTFMDWLGHGLQRAGLFGPSQFGLEAGTDMKRGGIGIESAAGPTIQQLLQFAQGTMQGKMGLQIEKAIPGYNLIKPAGNSGGK